MAKTPWMTSNQLVEAVKRKITFPTSQNTFNSNDILAFADEEMMIAQVPDILQFHQEHFVTYDRIAITSSARYQIPRRAIGMKLRDLFWEDNSGQLYEMTKVSSEDKAFYQRDVVSTQTIHKFYLEGNDIVLTPQMFSNPIGYLRPYYFLRPGQLVRDERAATIKFFVKTIVVDNSQIQAGDKLTIGSIALVAVSGAPSSSNEFQIAGTSALTADNLAAAILATEAVPFVLSNGLGTVTIKYEALSTSILSSNVSALAVSSSDVAQVEYETDPDLPTGLASTGASWSGRIATITVDNLMQSGDFIKVYGGTNYDGHYKVLEATSTQIQFILNTDPGVTGNPTIDQVVFGPGQKVDFLQTGGGHKTMNMDISLPSSFNYGMITLAGGTLNSNLVAGDYMIPAEEAIVPQIPSDLHNGLAERTAARILAAIGDTSGLAVSNAKIKDIEQSEAKLIDNRVEGSPTKIVNKYSILNSNKIGYRRRYF